MRAIMEMEAGVSSTDGSTMNVTMEFDDGGYSARKNSGGYVTTTSIQRCFTVKLRNN